MKKLITIVLLVVALLAVSNVSYGDPTIIKNSEGNFVSGSPRSIVDSEIYTEVGVEIYDSILIGNLDVGGVGNTTTGDILAEGGAGGSASQSQVNEGNQNEINISDNSVYSEIYPTNLLNPVGYMPMSDKLDELYLSKSIFKIQRNVYTTKELTRFANPGRFLGFLWPEWNNTYEIEIATFAKYKKTKVVRIVPSSQIAAGLGLVKIGEAQAYAKNLNKSEHQVMAALTYQATQAGATVVVFKTFSTSLAKVDSFVIGGGGVQGASTNSVFNGAAGIGSSQSEKKARACVVAELYR